MCVPERLCFIQKREGGEGHIWAVGWFFQHLTGYFATTHKWIQQWLVPLLCNETTPCVRSFWGLCRVTDSVLHCLTVVFSIDCGPTFPEVNQKNVLMTQCAHIFQNPTAAGSQLYGQPTSANNLLCDWCRFSNACLPELCPMCTMLSSALLIDDLPLFVSLQSTHPFFNSLHQK